MVGCEKLEETIEIQKYIYTTNACENINRQIENRRIKCGRILKSTEVVDINFYLIWENLDNGRCLSAMYSGGEKNNSKFKRK